MRDDLSVEWGVKCDEKYLNLVSNCNSRQVNISCEPGPKGTAKQGKKVKEKLLRSNKR